jgi:16S rRNA (cytidine1402-2'-O)-methyltransferase
VTAPVSGRLYVVGTPIGNLEDITHRAVRVLGEVDLIAAEDTRSARVLLARYGIKKKTVSFFCGNEARRSEMLLDQLRQGRQVALISESGMPGISDPGERLVRRCVEHEIEVDVIPGPNAALCALVLSGLPTDRFSFLGFLPRAGAARRQLLAQLAFQPGTLVLYEAPGRVAKTLAELAETLGGDRPAALVRELTKLHQEAVRDTLGGLAARHRETPPRGEVTLVVGPGHLSQEIPRADLEAEIVERLAQGQSPREIADALAACGRRQVYQRALALRREQE